MQDPRDVQGSRSLGHVKWTDAALGLCMPAQEIRSMQHEADATAPKAHAAAPA